ncbi:GNAT family N-acetyltransferase [Streptomyces salinarius]|uniref:GNAT family N-acetyltransferase n=1 Tax=Streptomyces salinarius TaxID=2762598 RepID=UPI002852567B|nr:GNAT family N-acetyltransferase [Streptomyces salinarius]
MRFSWGLLEPVMPVPYVPTLGPVRWDDPIPDLFEAVAEVASTGRFLPYDKDHRWSGRKTERVLVEAVEHGQEQTLVPSLVERGAGAVKVHVYGAAPDSLSVGADLARKLAAVHGAARARIVWFLGADQPDAYARGTRVQLKDFTAGPGGAPGVPVQEHKELPEEAGFQAFAAAMAEDGFAFLYEQMRAGTVGPVLTVLHDGRVAGAIGPMETMTDARGCARLLPQYFGVLPQHRGRGYGRALWRAAMRWGHQHGAAYQLLQTEVGGASDRLCRAEGLASLGFVNQSDV